MAQHLTPIDGGSEDGLSRYEQRALDRLLRGDSVSSVAEEIGVHRSTIYRYFKREPFMRAYREGRRQATENAVARLQALTSEAIEAVERVLVCGDPALELRAAIAVLDRALQGVNVFDLVQQLDELRAQREMLYGKRGGT